MVSEIPPESFADQPQPQPRTSGVAMASLVCGILGCVPIVTGLPAIICGIMGIRKTRDPAFTGRGMAVTGLILGAINLIAWSGILGSIAYFSFLFVKESNSARGAAEQFTRYLVEGNVNAALGLADPSFDRAELTRASERLKPWGKLTNLKVMTFGTSQKNGRQDLEFSGIATFEKESRAYSMSLTKEGESYRVMKFDFKGP